MARGDWTEGPRAGRPPIELDMDEINDHLICGCPGTEIAEVMGVHHDTVLRRVEEFSGMKFSAYAALMRRKGDQALRKVQFDKATGANKDGDNTMLVWLGKQRLDQTDVPKGSAVVPQEVLDFLKEAKEEKARLAALNAISPPDAQLENQALKENLHA